MITDPYFYLCTIPAILTIGMAKGGFGGGIGMIAVPLMSMAIPPLQAAAILLPILIAMDGIALWTFRGKWSREVLAIILPGAVLGIAIGSVSFRYLSDDMIRLLIGIIAITFCLNYWLKPPQSTRQEASRIKGTCWGVVSGFTSFGIHAGGPPINVFMLPLQLDKITLMGTMAIFFAIVNVVKLIPYAWQGQLSSTNLTTSLVLVPLAPIGVRLGFYFLNKISEQTVYRICYGGLFIVGIKLLWDGVH